MVTGVLVAAGLPAPCRRSSTLASVHVFRAQTDALPLSAIAPIMRETVVATEDERFYRHHGIDITGVIRALAAYDPLTRPSAARAHQIVVLRSLVRNGFLTEEEAALSTLAQPLRLGSGRALAAVRGVDLSPGPAFIW